MTGANLSLAISDSFMNAVEKNADWPLVFQTLKILNMMKSGMVI